MRPDNSIDYLEFASRDLVATKAFFVTLFGWSFQDYGPDYTAFEDGKMTGGFFHSENVLTAAEGAPLVVFYHSDLERVKTLVEKAGGVIKRDIFSFPGGRRFHFTEPGGNEFAVWSESGVDPAS
ncbi:MAG: VOC family protein [Verrucomicrobiaceae bacterium]|nr:MAG: VOC family protein [Verrucomicrobiaceae bacterium]